MMSSNDQAFVKAFARRNRTERTEQRRPAPSPATAQDSLTVDQSVAETAKIWVDPIDDQVVRADAAADAVVPKPHIEEIKTPAQPRPETAGAAEPAPEVIEPAPVEIEPEAIATPEIAAPSNSIVPAILSLQHIHTAYATAYTDVDPVVLPRQVPTEQDRISDAPAPEPEPVPAEPASVANVQVTRIDDPVPAAPAPHAIPNHAPTHAPFQAVWEVDVFDVPATVADLFFEGSLFQQIAENMSQAVGSGLKSVMVTSATAGEGRSTVAIGMAMAAAAAGIQVALVDADVEDPTLADDLRLDLEYGWVDSIRGGLPIREVAVHAVEDGVTLIPLMPPHGRTAATPFEVIQLIDLLQNKFELILIDGPVGTSSNMHQCASVVDSSIIVRDMSRTSTLAINEFSYRLREAGVHGVGVVENFT